MLLDLSVAFDTVDHSVLLHRLQTSFGISGALLDWFKSYLSARCRRVSIPTTLSDSLSLDWGVPQGSCLGPLLYIIYTSKLFNIIECHLPNSHCCGDDLQIYLSFEPDDLSTQQDAITVMQTCMDGICSFASSLLDYCNSLHYGLPQVQINKTQRVKNAAARLIPGQPRFCHTTPVLSQLHWLPIKYRTEFKILLMTFKAIQQDIPSKPAKKVCLRFQEARSSQHLVVEHSVMQPQSSGTIYPVKYPALTLCQILNALWKHIFLNKL